MLVPIKYCDSIISELYVSALTPSNLSFEDYEKLTDEWTTAKKYYDAAMSWHEDWKTAKAKEAQVEKLKQDK